MREQSNTTPIWCSRVPVEGTQHYAMYNMYIQMRLFLPEVYVRVYIYIMFLLFTCFYHTTRMKRDRNNLMLYIIIL